MRIKHISQKIKELDPQKDHLEIVQLLGFQAFAWDTKKSLEFALFRTYAVPSISALLSKTGEFRDRTRKRYDDTELILAEIAENGYDSPRAKEAFRRMNNMHNAYSISNDDMLYVLSTFVFEPFRWNDRFGWRKLTPEEKQAAFIYYQEVGKRMGIKNIPNELDSFESFNLDYEKHHFVYANTNREIGDYTVNLLLGFYLPTWLFPLGRPVIYSLMDERLMQAMNFPQPASWLKFLVLGGMKIRKFLLRFWPERKKPLLQTKVKRPSYPKGYKIKELGTFPTNEKWPS